MLGGGGGDEGAWEKGRGMWVLVEGWWSGGVVGGMLRQVGVRGGVERMGGLEKH